MFCGWCKHEGVHATSMARGSAPTRCTGCAACQRELKEAARQREQRK